MFILLFIVCFGIIIPRDVFALDVYNNVEELYSFFVDETEDDLGNLKFKLYDKTHELSFDSNYEYHNRSLSSGKINVLEETIDDYLDYI